MGGLWDYGGGLLTLLRPEDQFKKLGSIGREIFGTDKIKLLDKDRKEARDGEVGELFYRTPMLFKEYFKEPEKTREAFEGERPSDGDMARPDEDGYYILVDRRANMIITGGGNVYPSEVENALGVHEAMKDVAIIGVPDYKCGRAVEAIVVLHDGYEPSQELARDIVGSSRGRVAGYKQPKSIDFVRDEETPKAPSVKRLQRRLWERYGKWSED
jgi:acyl-CoA synthetase (AMP-forming)/AMP-acid ligase II